MLVQQFFRGHPGGQPLSLARTLLSRPPFTIRGPRRVEDLSLDAFNYGRRSLSPHLYHPAHRIGIALRAASTDIRTPSLMGINVDNIISVAFFMAGALGRDYGLSPRHDLLRRSLYRQHDPQRDHCLHYRRDGSLGGGVVCRPPTRGWRRASSSRRSGPP